MALPKCPNPICPSNKTSRKSSFGLSEETFGSRFKYYLVQCSTCGTVIGVIEYLNSGVLLEKQELAFNNFLLQYNDNNKKILNELYMQSNAIKVIMEKIGLDI